MEKVLFTEMQKYTEEPRNVSEGLWMWSDEAQTVEFVSSSPVEEGVLRKRRPSNVNFNNLQQRSEWLAEICTLNHRGRQSTRKRLSPAHLNAYRSSVMKRRGDFITTDDVKQVAVSLLQENYSLAIPFGFLAVLKSKELDEVLTTLLLYLSCFFEQKSLENKPKPLMAVDIITEHQMMAEALAKKEIAQKKLAVSYFSLIMGLEIEQHQHTSYHKMHHLPAPLGSSSGMSSQEAQRKPLSLLKKFFQLPDSEQKWAGCRPIVQNGCYMRFFCYVAWVTFGRKDLRDIQEEVGRLLYSDTFNTAVRNRTDGDSGTTITTVNGSVKTGEADPKETGCNGTFKHRASQRHPALSSTVNQRSPLMVCLLPSPKERSPHLFLGSRARRQRPLQADHCDTEALTEKLNQQLASVSFGILGKPLRQFNCSTLIPYGEQKTNRDEDDHCEPGSDVNNNSEDHPSIRVRGSRSSFTGPKSTGLARYGSSAHIKTSKTDAATEAVTSDTE